MWKNEVIIDERIWLYIQKQKDELYCDFLNMLHNQISVTSELSSDEKKRKFIVESDDREVVENIFKNLNTLNEKYSEMFDVLKMRNAKGFEDDGTHIDRETKTGMKSTFRRQNLSFNSEHDVGNAGIEIKTNILKPDDFGFDDTSKDAFKCNTCSEVVQTKELLLCGHPYCQKCMKNNTSCKTICQVCNETFEEVTGYKIDGLMGCQSLNGGEGNLDGHEGEGIIKIKFIINDGIQKENHPNPSKEYKGLRMRAFLPDSAEGRSLHKLIRKAYDNGVLFFIRRRSVGPDQVLLNNGITLKSNPKTYPDPDYFPLLKQELATFGLYPC